MSGTDIGDASTYAFGVRCPVLTQAMLLPAVRLPRRESEAGSGMAYARAMRCPVLTLRMVLCAIGLRARYEMSGTDLAYVATRTAMTKTPSTRTYGEVARALIVLCLPYEMSAVLVVTPYRVS
eukprot:3468408-Rhodomonas_salina.2